MKKKKSLLNNELKKELDAFLYQYSTKKEETYLKVLSILNYLYILAEKPDIERMEFDLQRINKLSNEYKRQLEKFEEAKTLDKFFEVFDLFIDAVNMDNIPDGQIKEYLKTI
jgi:hypothetical protein